jgi:hypothetical protein
LAHVVAQHARGRLLSHALGDPQQKGQLGRCQRLVQVFAYRPAVSDQLIQRAARMHKAPPFRQGQQPLPLRERLLDGRHLHAQGLVRLSEVRAAAHIIAQKVAQLAHLHQGQPVHPSLRFHASSP